DPRRLVAGVVAADAVVDPLEHRPAVRRRLPAAVARLAAGVALLAAAGGAGVLLGTTATELAPAAATGAAAEAEASHGGRGGEPPAAAAGAADRLALIAPVRTGVADNRRDDVAVHALGGRRPRERGPGGEHRQGPGPEPSSKSVRVHDPLLGNVKNVGTRARGCERCWVGRSVSASVRAMKNLQKAG